APFMPTMHQLADEQEDLDNMDESRKATRSGRTITKKITNTTPIIMFYLHARGFSLKIQQGHQ
ncbi:hypothetical protein IRJ41_017986, partial [Triplophysa rosa]